MIKMEMGLKSKWVEALTSGKYAQAVGTLYEGETPDGKPMMCCLGVLENICGTAAEDMRRCDMPEEVDERKSPKFLEELIPNPPGVASTTLGMFLANMNDEGSSFEEIAKYIKENL